MIKNILLVAAGGGLGSALRYGCYLLLKNQPFPFATVLINIAGSFVIGIIMALSIKDNNFSDNYKLFFATGLCGGFTTFSAFSYENVELIQTGRYNLVFLYILASVIAGIVAAWFGFKLIHH